MKEISVSLWELSEEDVMKLPGDFKLLYTTNPYGFRTYEITDARFIQNDLVKHKMKYEKGAHVFSFDDVSSIYGIFNVVIPQRVVERV